MKSMAPGSLLPSRSIFICFCRSINPKIQKYLAVFYFYLFCLAFDLTIYYKLSHVCLPILRRSTPEGIDNPFNKSGCEDLFFVCRCRSCSVAWFSYWFDNLVSSLREIPTIVPSSLGKYRRSSSKHQATGLSGDKLTTNPACSTIIGITYFEWEKLVKV